MNEHNNLYCLVVCSLLCCIAYVVHNPLCAITPPTYSANVTFFGDEVTEARDDHLAEQWMYGLNLSFTTITTSGSDIRNQWAVAGSGSIASAMSMITVATGTTTASSASVQSKRYIRYQPGRECYALFTGLFSTPATGANQWIGCFDVIDGFAVGYNGTTFSILYRSSITGSAVNTFIPQSSFNVDQLNGSGPSGITLNPQTLNIFRIQYSWFGAAPIQFSVMSNTGQFQVFHIIEFPNSFANPHLLLPQLPMRIEADNNATTSNVSVSNGCWAAGVIDTYRNPANGRIFVVSNILPSLTEAAGETQILTIQNPSTINSVINKIEAKICMLGGGGLDPNSEESSLRFLLNATITSPSYSAVNAGNSIMNITTTGTYSPGTGSFITLAPGTTYGNSGMMQYLDLKNNVLDIVLLPGQTLTVTAIAGTTTTFPIIGILGWDERY